MGLLEDSLKGHDNVIMCQVLLGCRLVFSFLAPLVGFLVRLLFMDIYPFYYSARSHMFRMGLCVFFVLSCVALRNKMPYNE